jgi:hypothetical protein
VSIFTHASQEDVDASYRLDLALVLGALVQQILGFTI